MGTPRLTVIGGGNMGAALVSGLLRAGWTPDELTIVEVDAARRSVLAGHPFAGVTVVAEAAGPGSMQAALIAVKPGDVPGAVARAVQCGARRVLSIAAGVSLTTLC
ncbi:MAG: NAD(P)-binding domain-containing protein, partial [Ilumatobacteraceae bacterium]